MFELKHLISPNFDATKLDSNHIDDLIDIFEDRVKNWLFNPIRILLSSEHGHVAAFAILITYFESIEIYKTGTSSRNSSKRHFVSSFLECFSSKSKDTPTKALNDAAEHMYQQARNGFAHEGLFKNRVYFSNANPNAILLTYPKVDEKLDTSNGVESIVINPFRFADIIFSHFDQYIHRLRDSSEVTIRENFVKAVNFLWELEYMPSIGMTEEEFIRTK